MHKTILAAALAVIGGVAAGSAGAVDLAQYLRRETFTDIKISPGASTWRQRCRRKTAPRSRSCG